MKARQRRLSDIFRKGEFTPFEKKVYAACAAIPRGEVRSYKWIAARINRPNAYRAVGNALHKNRYPGIIPCHRVIRADGSIGGFAYGARTKHRLLKEEGFNQVDFNLIEMI